MRSLNLLSGTFAIVSYRQYLCISGFELSNSQQSFETLRHRILLVPKVTIPSLTPVSSFGQPICPMARFLEMESFPLSHGVATNSVLPCLLARLQLIRMITLE